MNKNIKIMEKKKDHKKREYIEEKINQLKYMGKLSRNSSNHYEINSIL